MDVWFPLNNPIKPSGSVLYIICSIDKQPVSKSQKSYLSLKRQMCKTEHFLFRMDVTSLDTNIPQNEGILKLSVTKYMKISTKTTLPWVPEDIFFLSILMVRGVVASTVSKVYFILGILRTDLWSQGKTTYSYTLLAGNA